MAHCPKGLAASARLETQLTIAVPPPIAIPVLTRHQKYAAFGEPGEDMRTGTTLHPGQRGTKKLVAQYGAMLLCVRYRYDADRRRRLKTVELIVDEAPWDPPPVPFAHIVAIAIPYHETELRNRVKAAGGSWNPEKRYWELPDYVARQLGLKKRVVQ